MGDMLIDPTRVSYPSDKFSFSISDITRHKTIRWFNLIINLNGKYDVQVLLEDSRRNYIFPKIQSIITKSFDFSFTKRMLYQNRIKYKGKHMIFTKDERNTMKEFYITFRLEVARLERQDSSL